MNERFSDRARHAMALANLEAGKLNHATLRPAHLMLGLIAEGHCVATEALRLLDVDLNKVREQVQAQLPAGNEAVPFGARTQSREIKEVFATAIKEARSHDHRYVGTEHLVIGLLAQTDSIPSRVLRAQNVDIDRVREKTMAVLRTPVDETHDLVHSRHGELEWIHQQEIAKAFRSPQFWRTMILAVECANRLGTGELQGTHLLWALLREKNSEVSELLAGKGVTNEWLSEKLGIDSAGDDHARGAASRSASL